MCLEATCEALGRRLSVFHLPIEQLTQHSSILQSHLTYYHISNMFFITQKYIGRTPGKKNKNYSASDPQKWLCGTGPEGVQ